jgi:hypothetical protein
MLCEKGEMFEKLMFCLNLMKNLFELFEEFHEFLEKQLKMFEMKQKYFHLPRDFYFIFEEFMKMFEEFYDLPRNFILIYLNLFEKMLFCEEFHKKMLEKLLKFK